MDFSQYFIKYKHKSFAVNLVGCNTLRFTNVLEVIEYSMIPYFCFV
jgi:hypothetical protein